MSNQYESENVKRIVEEVKSHLTGSDKENLKYLNEQISKYKDSPEGPNIVYHLSLLLWNYMPKNFKQQFEAALKSDIANSPQGLPPQSMLSELKSDRRRGVEENLSKAKKDE